MRKETEMNTALINELPTAPPCLGCDRLARFVGLEAYECRCGALHHDALATSQDKFSQDESTARLEDPALLRTLAADKFDVLAEEVRAEGWGWVECEIESEGSGLDVRRYGTEPKDERVPTPDEARIIAALQAECQRLMKAYERNEEECDPDDEAYCAEEQRLLGALEDVDRRIEAAQVALQEWTPEQMARLGALLCIDTWGGVVVHRGLFRRSDGPPVRGRGRLRRSPEFSEDLMRDLSAHRTAALQAALMQNTHVALATLVHRMAETLFERYGRGSDVVKMHVRATGHEALVLNATGYEESPAGWLMRRADLEWAERLPGDSAAMFGWLLAQDQTTLLALLAYCAARSIDAVSSHERCRDQSDAIGEALELDMADWWMAGAANFLDQVTRSRAVDVVREATGIDCSGAVAGMKRSEAIRHCAAKLEGTRWLPTPLCALPAAASANEDNE
jgi:ParB family chromosome partitioning protein